MIKKQTKKHRLFSTIFDRVFQYSTTQFITILTFFVMLHGKEKLNVTKYDIGSNNKIFEKSLRCFI